MSERNIQLLDGLEPMSEEDITEIWKKANEAYGDQSFLASDVIDLVNALEAAYTQIDSLQQQVNDQVQEIHMLNVANNIQKDTALDWDKLVDRVTAERDALREQLAERDAVIRRLTYKLEEARQGLGGGKG